PRRACSEWHTLIEQVFLLIINVMPIQECAIFLLECLEPVVLALAADIRINFGELRLADGESSITVLPAEAEHPRERFFHPAGRTVFDELQRLADRQTRRNSQQEMK